MALSRKPQEIVEDSKNPLLSKHESWGRVPVGDIADILNGFAFKSSKFTNDKGVPLIRIRDVGKDSSETYYDGEFDETYLVSDGDLLVGMDGDFRAAIWKGGIALLNQRVCKISLKTDEYDFRFLSYVLQPYLDAIHAETSAVTVKHLSSKSISEIPLPLPPKEQQKRIVAKIEELFSHIDAGIEALKKSKQLLKQYRQSVLKAAVTGELTKKWRDAQGRASVAGGRTPGATEAKYETAQELLERILKERRQKWEEQQLEQFKAKGKMPKDDKWKEKYKEPEELEDIPDEELPNTWMWVAIGQVFDVFVGATPSRKKPDYWEGNINWVSSGEVAFCHIKDTKEKITQEGLQNSSTELHPPGTVMLGMIGEGKTRGQAAILDIDAAHNQNTAAIEKIIPEQSSEYLYYYLMQQYEITRKRGSGNNQKALNKTRVQSIEFPLPPLKEQEAIAELLMEKFSAIEHLEKEIDLQLRKTGINKQSILVSAFSGKV